MNRRTYSIHPRFLSYILSKTKNRGSVRDSGLTEAAVAVLLIRLHKSRRSPTVAQGIHCVRGSSIDTLNKNRGGLVIAFSREMTFLLYLL